MKEASGKKKKKTIEDSQVQQSSLVINGDGNVGDDESMDDHDFYALNKLLWSWYTCFNYYLMGS